MFAACSKCEHRPKATLKELNEDENIFAYQVDALTGIVVCENECGLAYCRSCFDYRVTPTIEELK